MSDWSDQGLPDPVLSGYGYLIDAGLERTGFDWSKARQQRADTANRRQFSASVILTHAQLIAAEAFIASSGYEWFSMDVLSGAEDGSPCSELQVRLIDAYSVTSVGLRAYKLGMELEHNDSSCCVVDTFTDSDSTYITNHTADNGAAWSASSPGNLPYIQGNKLRVSYGLGRAGAAYVACQNPTAMSAECAIADADNYGGAGIVFGFDGNLASSLYRYPNAGVLIFFRAWGGTITLRSAINGVDQGALATLTGFEFALAITRDGDTINWAVTGDDTASGSFDQSLPGSNAGVWLWKFTSESPDYWELDNVSIC